MKKIKILILFLFILFIFTYAKTEIIAAEFNPGNIISDEEILDITSMTQKDVENFLNSKSGILKNYNVKIDIKNEPLGIQPAAQFIYTRSVKNGINPKFTLVLLQKEQSLITDANPNQKNLDFATGYGCPDGSKCSERWRGFSRQVNSATLQFKDYMDNPQDYRYQVGQIYNFNDYGKNETVIIQNRATAGLYNYTPHVYNGNYNFWKLWHEWFPISIYPNGALLQAKGDPVVYLIQNGTKRPFKNKLALSSRYSLDKIIQVPKEIINQYPTGKAIQHPQFALYRSPKGTVYMLIDDIKHGFTSAEALRLLGINPEEIENIDQTTLDKIPEGKPFTVNSSYPTGALLRNKQTKTLYYVKEGKRYPVMDIKIVEINFGKNMPITEVNSVELRKYISMPPIYIKDGELITSDNPKHPAVYVISDGKKLPILSGEIFEKLGYKWNNIISVPDNIINMHPTGAPIQ